MAEVDAALARLLNPAEKRPFGSDRDPFKTPLSGNPRPKTSKRVEEDEQQRREEEEEKAQDPMKGLKELLIAAMRDPAVQEAQAMHIKGAVAESLGDMVTRMSKIEERVDGVSSGLNKVHEQADRDRGEVTKLALKVKGIESLSTKTHNEGLVQRGQISELEGKVERDLQALDKHVSTCEGRVKRMEQQVAGMKARMDELGASGEESAAVAALRAQVVALMEHVTAMGKRGAMQAEGGAEQAGGGAGTPPSAAATVQAKLKAEADAAVVQLKLEGFNGISAEKQDAELCQEVGQMLSNLHPARTQIMVSEASWLPGRKQLMVKLLTPAMAASVRGLRARLGEGQRIVQWYGPTEMAVRAVLYKQREAMLAADQQADVRVVGSRMWVGKEERPLSQEAITAGMKVITAPKRTAGAHGNRQQHQGPPGQAQAREGATGGGRGGAHTGGRGGAGAWGRGGAHTGGRGSGQQHNA
jgi:hypothetical protein